MPFLSILEQSNGKKLVCCEDNNCKAGFPSKKSILWMNAECFNESGSCCDCIVVCVSNDKIFEIYALELKNIKKLVKI